MKKIKKPYKYIFKSPRVFKGEEGSEYYGHLLKHYVRIYGPDLGQKMALSAYKSFKIKTEHGRK